MNAMTPALRRLKEIVGDQEIDLDHNTIMQRLYELVGMQREQHEEKREHERPLLVVIGGHRDRRR